MSELPDGRGRLPRWYGEDDEDLVVSALWNRVQRIRTKQQWRQSSDELALRLFCDMKYIGYRGASSNYEIADVLDMRMADNVIRPIVRTLHSKIIRRRVAPKVTPVGSSWKQKKQCELLERWIGGKFRQVGADDLFSQAVWNGYILGSGVIKSYGDPDDGAGLEVVPTYEIIVDDSEARYGLAGLRNLYIARVMDRGVVRAKYPDVDEETIEKAGTVAGLRGWVDNLGTWSSDSDEDSVVVLEAWHLPSRKFDWDEDEEGDGRHVISLDTGVLVDEEWKRDHFPLAFFHAERRPLGLWGIGVPEDQAGAQLEINRTTGARQTMLRLLSMPVWLVERGARIFKNQIIPGIIGRGIEYTGTKPDLFVPNAVPGELWNHTDYLKRNMFENRGVSQLSAQMLKPAGLNSGKALRAFGEMESELLVDPLRSYSDMVLRAAELLIEEQKELGEEAAEHAVTAIGDGRVDRIRWADVDLDRDKYVIEVTDTSALSATVAGRIEDVYDLRDLGAIQDPDEIRDLLQLPDLERQKRRAMSNRLLMERVIEQLILEKGMSITPEPEWDVALGVQMGLERINEVQCYEDAPEENLEKLREFVELCRLEVAKQNPQPDPSALPPAEGDASAPPPVAPPPPAQLAPMPTGVA